MVLELFRELLGVGGLWWDHLPLPGLLQDGAVPVVGPHGSHHNPVLGGGGGGSKEWVRGLLLPHV